MSGLFCSLLGCDEAVLQAGEAGAECRLGPEPCADGLTCLNGRCQAGSKDQGQAPLEVVFTIADCYLAADGQSRTAILVEANDADGEPYEGELLGFSKPARGWPNGPTDHSIRWRSGTNGLRGVSNRRATPLSRIRDGLCRLYICTS